MASELMSLKLLPALGKVTAPGRLLLRTVATKASSQSRLVWSASSSSTPLPCPSTNTPSSGTLMLQNIWAVLAATTCPVLFLSMPPSSLVKFLS